MAWVYILRGSNGRHYIGSTNDLERRLSEHRNGKTYSTRRLGESLTLIAQKEVSLLIEARRFERELKRMKSPKLAINRLNGRDSPESIRGWS